jgi:Flp pilus assembly protein protease CpaA
MGDIKLAAALGALLGPSLGTVAMLLSMIAGGVVAFTSSLGEKAVARKDVSEVAIPYGLALAIGTLLTLVVCLWTGKEHWFWSTTAVAMQ